MNTATTHRLAAFTLALLMTLGMLGTVNLLATSDAPAAQIARVEGGATRS